MRLSIVIPVYNGAATIQPLVERLFHLFAGRFDLEVVLVNDGSPKDNSAEVCRILAERDDRVLFVDLSRNFGEHNAVMAGLNYCTGDAAVIIDDDFQNPPEEIERLAAKLAEGYDVVFGQYERKHHARWRNLGSRFNNLMATLMIGKPLDLYLSSFKALDRFVIDELVKYRGPYPYIDGLIWRVTRNYATVLVRHDPRQEGRSGYTLWKLISLWLNMFTSFSVLPLRAAACTGALCALACLLFAVVCLVEKLRDPSLPMGWASLMVGMLGLFGVTLLALGVVGEYVGRLFMQHSGQPQFVVRRAVLQQEPRRRDPKLRAADGALPAADRTASREFTATVAGDR
jgi:undecaprenyl-phosphate 4-deoxy-4-formamido-L-arabinose transferase